MNIKTPNKSQEEKEKKSRIEKEWRKNHKEWIQKRDKQYYQDNKEKISKWKAEYYQNNKKQIRQYNQIPEIKEKKRIYERLLRKNNLNYKIASNLRKRLRNALSGQTKSQSTLNLLGCSFDFLKSYLESKFQNNMSWEYFGQWHIDHIRPCIAFDLSLHEQQKLCFHYTNLQPLWAIDNLKKSDKLYDNTLGRKVNQVFPLSLEKHNSLVLDAQN